jgi:hypothetical protein
MSPFGLSVFDLAVTSVVAFWVSVLVVRAATMITRIRSGPVATVLALSPFAKLAFDLARGAPHAAALARATGPDLATPGGSFSVGLGFTGARVSLQALLQRKVGDDYVPVTVGDHLATAAPPDLRSLLSIAGLGIAVVAIALLLWRVAAAISFEWERRRLRVVAARRISRTGRVDIYLSWAHRGSPFAGGIFRPYVCIPIDAMRIWTRDERRAALAHELAHHRMGDVALRALIGVLTDVFWFVPGIRRYAADVFDHLEESADLAAVRRGCSPASLASALLRVAETRLRRPRPALALGGPSRRLERRVQALLVGPPRPRRGFSWIGARALFAVVTFQTVLFAVVGGFHP